MKLVEIRIPQEQGQSFIFLNEKKKFVPWHNHPEYELCLITNGKGKRMIGDHIDRFEENDLVFLGPYLPHVWLCDEEYNGDSTNPFLGEAIVIQFNENFLGETFMQLQENESLKKAFISSFRGCSLSGKISLEIGDILKAMIVMNHTERLYATLTIFCKLSQNQDFQQLASSSFMQFYQSNEKQNEPIQKVTQYILQNFQKNIQVEDILNIANMSNTTFCIAFKKTYQVTYQEYLKTIRIGYACRLITNGVKTISEIAYSSGFENLSNFNRQFKQVKGVTPSQHKMQIGDK